MFGVLPPKGPVPRPKIWCTGPPSERPLLSPKNLVFGLGPGSLKTPSLVFDMLPPKRPVLTKKLVFQAALQEHYCYDTKNLVFGSGPVLTPKQQSNPGMLQYGLKIWCSGPLSKGATFVVSRCVGNSTDFVHDAWLRNGLTQRKLARARGIFCFALIGLGERFLVSELVQMQFGDSSRALEGTKFLVLAGSGEALRTPKLLVAVVSRGADFVHGETLLASGCMLQANRFVVSELGWSKDLQHFWVSCLPNTKP